MLQAIVLSALVALQAAGQFDLAVRRLIIRMDREALELIRRQREHERQLERWGLPLPKR